MSTPNDNQEAIQKFKELLNDVDVCMLVTTDDLGKITSRPMMTIDVDPEGNVWFFTNEFSDKVHDTARDNAVSLIYSHPAKNIYVHVNGKATFLQNMAKVKELWTPPLTAWFPQGLKDPKLCLMKISTEEADYWDSTSSRMAAFFHIAHA